MPVGEGRFTPEKLAAALADVCALLDLDHCGAQLLRFTNNAVFKLAHAPVVVRIVGSRTLRHRVDKVVKIAQWFAAHDIPAVRLLPAFDTYLLGYRSRATYLAERYARRIYAGGGWLHPAGTG